MARASTPSSRCFGKARQGKHGRQEIDRREPEAVRMKTTTSPVYESGISLGELYSESALTLGTICFQGNSGIGYQRPRANNTHHEGFRLQSGYGRLFIAGMRRLTTQRLSDTLIALKTKGNTKRLLEETSHEPEKLHLQHACDGMLDHNCCADAGSWHCSNEH